MFVVTALMRSDGLGERVRGRRPGESGYYEGEGWYFVAAATYEHQHHFATGAELSGLDRRLLEACGQRRPQRLGEVSIDPKASWKTFFTGQAAKNFGTDCQNGCIALRSAVCGVVISCC
jgi:hypothetical protein